MKYPIYILKRKIEAIFIAPFIVFGQLIHLIIEKKPKYDLYFFFPFYHLGGAEKIHLQIAQLAKDKKAVVVFTRKSENPGFLQSFKEIGIDIEISSSFTNNDLFRLPINLIARGYYAARINSDNATVFNGQSNFGYKISPWINPTIDQFELIHSFNSFSWIRIPFICFYTKTIMISEIKIQEHCIQYDKIDVPEEFVKRIEYIPNAVDPIANYTEKIWTKPLKMIYVGRGSVEKRLPSIVALAQKIKEARLPFEIELIGDVEDYITEDAKAFLILSGMINDKEVLNTKYKSAHFIVLLSSTEGMPLVVLEAMQNGCIPIVTKVGDLPLVINKENGILIENNETTVVQETFEQLNVITQMNSDQLNSLSLNSRNMIANKYSMTQFASNYKKLLSI